MQFSKQLMSGPIPQKLMLTLRGGVGVGDTYFLVGVFFPGAKPSQLFFTGTSVERYILVYLPYVLLITSLFIIDFRRPC